MRRSVRAIMIVGLGLSPILGLAILGGVSVAPLLIYNPSPSEPVGFYRLSRANPGPGRLIAFRVPNEGKTYAAAHIRYVVRNSILKEIVAGAGSVICEQGGTIFIDGRRRGTVAWRDHQGNLLPHWSGCRQLKLGEFFVLSNRIPNSYDSRYYGPVRTGDVVGVYVPLWTD